MAASSGSSSSGGTGAADSGIIHQLSQKEDEAAGFLYGLDIDISKLSASAALNSGSFGSETNVPGSGGDGASGFFYNVSTAVNAAPRGAGGGAARSRSTSSEDASALSFPGCSISTAGAASGSGTTSAKNNGAGARCSVCGDEASGFHYGVDSCEGCKGFFRRCIIQGLTQQCANAEKCEITPLTRNSCQFCRLKKCFAVGMSRGASRLGRRPKRLKAHYSAEAKNTLPAKQVTIAPQPLFASKLPLSMAELEALLEKLNSQNRYNIKLPSLLAALNSLLQDGGSVSAPAIEDRLASDVGSVALSAGPVPPESDGKRATLTSRQLSPDTTGSETSLSGAGDMGPLTNGIATACQIKAEPSVVNSSSALTFHSTGAIDSYPKTNPHIANTCDARAFVGTVYHQLREAEQRRRMLGEPPKPIAATLSSAAGASAAPAAEINTQTVPETIAVPSASDDDGAIRQALAELVDEARRLPVSGSERANLVEQVIRSVIDAHMNTCNYTKEKIELGLQRYIQAQQWGAGSETSEDDIDPMKVWSAFVANMAPVIQRVVTFSKSLPGFSELCQDDQIKLIKQGSFEVILARYVPLFTDKGMFVPDMTVRVPHHVIQRMPLGGFFCEQHKFANVVNKLELCDGEIGLLTAIMIINPDRVGITNRRAVYKLRGLLLQSLYVYMKSIRLEKTDEKFMSIVDILVLSDHINKLHSCALNNMKLSSPDMKFPELHLEVYDGLP